MKFPVGASVYNYDTRTVNDAGRAPIGEYIIVGESVFSRREVYMIGKLVRCDKKEVVFDHFRGREIEGTTWHLRPENCDATFIQKCRLALEREKKNAARNRKQGVVVDGQWKGQ